MNTEKILEEVQKELNKKEAVWSKTKLHPAWDHESCLVNGERKIHFGGSFKTNERKKVFLSGILPSYQNKMIDIGEPAIKIGVSFERGPKAIADAIEKRLLPIYETQLSTANEKLAETLARDGAFEETLNKIVSILGARPSTYNKEVYQKIKEIHARVSVNHSNSVSIKLDCNDKQAEKILLFIKETL